MTPSLSTKIFFDSSRTEAPAIPGVEPIDVAAQPEAAAALARLDIAVPGDLPALLASEPGGKLRLVGLRLTVEEATELAQGRGVAGPPPRVLSTGWCPDCFRAKRILDEAGVAYDDVDVDGDRQLAAELVRRSGGRRVVPTLVFAGRVWAFNPSPPLLRRLIGSTAP
jgi:mycoredoxin